MDGAPQPQPPPPCPLLDQLDPFLRELLRDPKRQPTVCKDREQFVRELLVGKHIDEILVFPDGLRALDLFESMPKIFRDAVKGEQNMQGFCRALRDEQKTPLDSVDASLYFWDGRSERRLKKDTKGNKVKNLQQKYEVVCERGSEMQEPLYLAEMRYTTKRKMPDGYKSSTLLTEDLKDKIPASFWMPLWDRGHVFVGGEYSGSSMHMDQCLWSNIGKNFAGYKILFTWRYGAESNAALEAMYKTIMKPPFTAEEKRVLSMANKVALVGPGDLFLFSGANAHMTLGVGKDLSLSAYESYVNLNPTNVSIFRRSGCKEHWEDCIMEDDELDDLQDDVIDQVEKMLLKLDDLRENLPDQRQRRETNAAIHTFVPAMVRELCNSKFFRRELLSIREIKSQLHHILEDWESSSSKECIRKRRCTHSRSPSPRVNKRAR